MEYKCDECKTKVTPKRKPRKHILCPSCLKNKNKFKCITCGVLEKPSKTSRRKTFLCKDCRKDKKEFNKVLKNNDILDINEIKSFLLEKDFILSKTGIPYKYYGGTRVSISDRTGLPLILVTSGGNSTCFIDNSILKILPDEAIKDVKIIINTITKTWEEQYKG